MILVWRWLRRYNCDLTFYSFLQNRRIQTIHVKPNILRANGQISHNSDSQYIPLKRRLESVVRISLYYHLQTPAHAKKMYWSNLNFPRINPTSSYKSNFCEKQLIPNDATVIVQKRLFWPKNAQLCRYYVWTMSVPSVFDMASELMLCYIFHQALSNYTNT